MRYPLVLLLGLCLFFSVGRASPWSASDYEIFKLNDKVKEDLGKDTTFYSWLNLPKGPKSSYEEINQAYRKLSKRIHPDRFAGKSKKLRKQAEEKFQRFSLVGNILRDRALKKRYDYFLDKGFPKWKGTGYYYSKFRPGVALTIGLLFVIAGVLQFVALKINRKQDYKRVKGLREEIKRQAWGGSTIPPTDGLDRKISNQMTGKDFIIKADGNVYYVDTDEKGNQSLFEVDENDVNVNLSYKESILFKMPAFVWNCTLGRIESLKIDTTPYYNREKKNSTNDNAKLVKEKPKKKQKRGEKIELPNGKVIYGRNVNKTQRRK